VFIAVIEIESAAGVRETVFDGVPDPEGSVGDDQHVLGFSQSTVDGLPVELAHEVFDAQASAGVATLADDGAAGRGGSSMIEAEDGGDVDPVPLGVALRIIRWEEEADVSLLR
jgi:hypothetical protein